MADVERCITFRDGRFPCDDVRISVVCAACPIRILFHGPIGRVQRLERPVHLQWITLHPPDKGHRRGVQHPDFGTFVDIAGMQERPAASDLQAVQEAILRSVEHRAAFVPERLIAAPRQHRKSSIVQHDPEPVLRHPQAQLLRRLQRLRCHREVSPPAAQIPFDAPFHAQGIPLRDQVDVKASLLPMQETGHPIGRMLQERAPVMRLCDNRCGRTHDQGQRPALHDIRVREEQRLQPLPVQPGLFDDQPVAGQAFRPDYKALPAREADYGTFEDRCMDHVPVCSGHGIQAHLMEGQPGGHRPGIVIAGESAGGVVKVVGDNLMYPMRGLSGLVDPMVQARRQEGRLVVDIVIAAFEESVQARLEGLRSPAHLHQTWNIVRNAQGIFPAGTFVEKGAPPLRVPGAFSHRGRVPIGGLRAGGMAERKVVQPGAGGIARHHEAAHAVVGHVGTPEVPPVAAHPGVFRRHGIPAQPFRHSGDRRVAGGILHRPVARAGDAPGDISPSPIFFQSAAALGFVIGRKDFRILKHRGQSLLIINSFQPLDEGIGQDDFGIGTTLGSPVGVSAPGIGQKAIVPVNGKQRIHDVPFAVGIQERDHRQGRPIGVPKGVEIVIIYLVPRGRPFSGPVHRHQHRVVQARVEHPFVAAVSLDLHASQNVIPSGFAMGTDLAERLPFHLAQVFLGLFRPDIGDADAHFHVRLVKSDRRDVSIDRRPYEWCRTPQMEIHRIGRAVVPSTLNGLITRDI